MMDKKLPFRSQLADLLLSDMISSHYYWLVQPESLQLFKYRRTDPTSPTSAKNHFSVQLRMIEITFTIASILMQNVIWDPVNREDQQSKYSETVIIEMTWFANVCLSARWTLVSIARKRDKMLIFKKLFYMFSLKSDRLGMSKIKILHLNHKKATKVTVLLWLLSL